MTNIVPTKMMLKMSTIVEIFSALQQFDTYTKLVKKGKETESVKVPYAFDPMTLVAIGLNIQSVRGLVEANAKVMEALQKQHGLDEPYDDDKADPVERMARNTCVKQFNEASRTVVEMEHEVKQRILKISELMKGGPISPNIIAILSPILDFEGDADDGDSGDEE